MSVATPLTRERILTAARSLPAAPQAMAGLFELLQDPNVELAQVAEQVSVDPALSSRIVRISNSVVFGGGGSVGSVDDAVRRVGFSEILGLVGAATVTTMIDRNLAGYGIPAERLRKSLLLHAIASETLARFTTIEPRTAYTAGLLRALGMMVIARVGVAGGGTVGVFDPARHSTYAEWEGENFGIAGTEVTAMILTEWRFPPEVVKAIREHLLVDDGEDHGSFACLLHLAGAVVGAAGLALEGEAICWRPTPAKLASLGLDDAQWQEANLQARASFDRMVAALS